MKKRVLSLSLSLAFACSLLSVGTLAVDLPQGWWPVWSAYSDAVNAGNDDDILAKGDAVIALYTAAPRNLDIANGLFVVYSTRLERLIFENRGDYDNAVKNTEALLEICQYLRQNDPNGASFADWIIRCNAHLEVVRPFVGVYAASYARGSAYGSRIAASSGAYYGSISDGGHYGDRSICSFYVLLESETAGQYDYLIAPRADGKRVILINLNFKGEGATARAVPSGQYDSRLRETLSYLATVQSPVLLRIGAEMDVWTDMASPAEYIAAYQHIASLARSLAPRVELVWSPNYTGSWGADAAAYYPGDSVVDWVGLSLYYNYTPADPSARLEAKEYFHWCDFADPIANAARVLDIAKAHNKPAIATEGGVHRGNGEAYAAKQAAKEFSTLTMVYPEVKALVYFDRKEGANDFTLTGSVKSAADDAIAANPSLIAPGASSAATFVPIASLNEPMTGALVLGATGRTYRSGDMSAVWALDGAKKETAGSPNQYRVDLTSLSAGAHKLELTLSDGKGYSVSKTYTLDYSGGTVKITEGYTAPTPAPTPSPAPAPTTAAPGVSVNGKAVQWTDAAPFIDENSRTMVPLRAVGDALGLTVGWDGEAREASFTDGSKTICFPIGSTDARTSDGRTVTMDTAAVIVGSRTYAPVRYLAEFFGRTVDWDGATRTVVIK